MKCISSSLLLVSLSIAGCNALRVPFMTRSESLRRRSGGSSITVSRPGSKVSTTQVLAASGSAENNTLGINDVHDLIYMANVSVGNNEYIVQLDTGSSDLWIKGPSSPLPNANQTSTTYNLSYGIGWAFGHVSTAPVEFAGFTIPSQAFLDVSQASNPALSNGANGVIGLGFDSLSTVDALVNQTGSSTGRTVLFNAFSQEPQEPNFISFVLQRSTDPTADVEGSFTIGEVDPQYTDIQNSPAVPTFPETFPKRWSILLDNYIVGSQTYTVSTSVSGAPSNKAVIMLDTGTSYTYVTTEIAQNIYGSVSGAQFSSSLQQWVVPCDAEIDMALQIGGQVYALHPLDVVVPSFNDPTQCLGSFVPQPVSVNGGQFDWLVGVNVLRSVYGMYDFGDFDSASQMGNPYVKLLSIVDPNSASQEFHTVRGGTSAAGNITYNASNSSSSSGSDTTFSVSNNVADSLSKIVDYIPVMLGILGLNALALIIVAAVGITYLFRRKRKSGKKSRTSGSGLNTMPLNNTPSTPQPRPFSSASYQPVDTTINVPEDMPFTPPQPAFHGEGGSRQRPHSTGSPSSQAFPPREYRVSAAGSDVTAFEPPSPQFLRTDGYKGGDGDRPKSVA